MLRKVALRPLGACLRALSHDAGGAGTGSSGTSVSAPSGSKPAKQACPSDAPSCISGAWREVRGRALVRSRVCAAAELGLNEGARMPAGGRYAALRPGGFRATSLAPALRCTHRVPDTGRGAR